MSRAGRFVVPASLALALAALDEAAALFAASFGRRAAALRKLVKGYRFEEALAALREAAAGLRPRG
jgi:hypothetical protein